MPRASRATPSSESATSWPGRSAPSWSAPARRWRNWPERARWKSATRSSAARFGTHRHQPQPATGETREGFLGRSSASSKRIAGALHPARPRPARSSRCAAARTTTGTGLRRIVQHLEQGDYGQTGLDYPAWNRSFCRACRSTRNGKPASRAVIWASFSPRPPSARH